MLLAVCCSRFLQAPLRPLVLYVGGLPLASLQPLQAGLMDSEQCRMLLCKTSFMADSYSPGNASATMHTEQQLVACYPRSGSEKCATLALGWMLRFIFHHKYCNSGSLLFFFLHHAEAQLHA